MNPLLDLEAHPVIGHRGAAGLAPENTCPSLELALAQGGDAFEFDLHLAADGVPVLIHDPSLDRTTNARGPVAERSSGELAELDAGYHFTPDQGRTVPWRGRGIGVPSLGEVLVRFPSTPLLIELKTVAVAEPVRRVLLEHDAVGRVVVGSFLGEALTPFRDGRFATSAARGTVLRRWLGSLIGLGGGPRLERVYAVPDRHWDRVPVPTPGFIRAARRVGCPVHVWTIDDPRRAALLWSRGVSGIITNFPARLVAERNRQFA